MFKRDYSKLNESALIAEVQSIDWHTHLLPHDQNPSDLFDSFFSKITEVVDRHIPIKQLSEREIKTQSKPWVTKGIRNSIKVKNRLYLKFLKTKSSYYYERFKYYRNKVNHLL
jgi:hypothetical protein